MFLGGGDPCTRWSNLRILRSTKPLNFAAAGRNRSWNTCSICCSLPGITARSQYNTITLVFCDVGAELALARAKPVPAASAPKDAPIRCSQIRLFISPPQLRLLADVCLSGEVRASPKNVPEACGSLPRPLAWARGVRHSNRSLASDSVVRDRF